MKTIATVIFSKNRPLQLDLALSSFFLNCQDPKQTDVTVLYKATTIGYRNAYEAVKQDYPNATFLKENIFKDDLISLLEDKTYVLFVVDDCIFTQKFSFLEIGGVLEYWTNDQIGFSFRLGENISHCYTVNKPQKSKNILERYGRVFVNWTEQELDFSYPLELSSSIYKVENILYPIVMTMYYNSPNSLEAAMASYSRSLSRNYPMLQYFKQSLAFCSPLNKVQKIAPNNRCSGSAIFSPENLLIEYEEGARVDPKRFVGFVPSSPHQEVELP